MPINGPMDLSGTSDKADESPLRRYCALEYRPREWTSGSHQVAYIVVLVLEDEVGNLRFLVHPELRSVVSGNDQSYLESLLKDFLVRAKLHPAALFKHLSSLGVGPLVTHEVGTVISDRPPLFELCSRFVWL
jgi:hypothetical protein